MITIDGSFGEGGGQILRTSLALAAITGESVTIDNIRANREKPGLRPQHLTGALAVAEICDAKVAGADVGSRKLVFRPGKIQPGSYEFDVSKIRASAGSTSLVLQTVLWPLAISGKKSHVTIKGGTHVPFAPTFNYIDDTFIPTIAEMGLHCQCSIKRAGYYPTGGGEIHLDIAGIDGLKPVSFVDTQKPFQIYLTSAVSKLPIGIAERQLNTASDRLIAMGLRFEESVKEYPSGGPGTLVFISLRSGQARAGFQSLGALRKRAEKVADEACDELDAYLRADMALDKHLADQLIIPMALAQGNSEFTTAEITLHLMTNIAVVEKFLPVHFHVSNGIGEPGTVRRVS